MLFSEEANLETGKIKSQKTSVYG